MRGTFSKYTVLQYCLSIILLLCLAVSSQAQYLAEGDIIKKPAGPDRPVYDLANVLTGAQKAALENKIISFWDTTSTAPIVVTLNSVEPYAIDRYAYSIGHYWGAGTAKQDNGVVLLVAVKDRKVFIATGYGVEGALPDATAKYIVDNEIIPYFKNGDYAGGITAGVDAIAKATAGEYSKARSQRAKKQEKGIGSGWLFFLIIFFFFIIIPALRARKYKNKQFGNKKGGMDWLTTLILMNQMGGRRGRGWDDFKGGGGDFGGFGGGGGFGGFGGGDFGGGGAGGSW